MTLAAKVDERTHEIAKRSELKILIYDIERMKGSAAVEFWSLSDFKNRRIHADDVTAWPRTICIAWRFLGDNRTQFASEWADGQQGMHQRIWDAFNQADITANPNANSKTAAKAATNPKSYATHASTATNPNAAAPAAATLDPTRLRSHVDLRILRRQIRSPSPSKRLRNQTRDGCGAGVMALAKYNTREHKALAAQFAADIRAGRGWCVEPICVMTTRFIPPGTPRRGWHVPHNEDGVTYRGGPAHARCNGAENARRNNPKRGTKRRHWAL